MIKMEILFLLAPQGQNSPDRQFKGHEILSYSVCEMLLSYAFKTSYLNTFFYWYTLKHGLKLQFLF